MIVLLILPNNKNLTVVISNTRILLTKMATSLTTITHYRTLVHNHNCVKLHTHPSFNFLSTKPSHKFHLHNNNAQLTFKTSLSAISSSQGAVTEGTIEFLDSVIVYGLDGNGIPISDLWKDRKAVVAFARHFGCVLCRKRADLLVAEKDKMDAAGVALVLIGPGSVDQAKVFYEQTKFKGEVYADPSYSSYKALKFVSGITTTFTPGAGLKIIQLYMEGYRQDWELSFEKDTRTKGGWQQGGIIVAGPGKDNISYLHKDKEAGDDPDVEDILKACCVQGS